MVGDPECDVLYFDGPKRVMVPSLHMGESRIMIERPERPKGNLSNNR